jgi:hypothetical protein
MEQKTISLVEVGDQLKAIFVPPLPMTRLFDITASDHPMAAVEGSDKILSITYDRQTFAHGSRRPYENFVNFHAQRMTRVENGQRKLGYELVESRVAGIGQRALAGQKVARAA